MSVIQKVATAEKLLSLTITPSSLVGGQSANGTAKLDGPAPAGGAVVTLTSDNPHVQCPPSLTIPEGSTTGSFGISTTYVDMRTDASVTGTYNASSKVAPIELLPVVVLVSVTLDPPSVFGSEVSQATVKLSGPAPGNGVVVTLTSSDPATIHTDPSVTVPGGSDHATVPVTTRSVVQEVNGYVFALYGGKSAAGQLTVKAPKVQSLELAASTLVGGNGTTGTLTLNVPAPSSGYAVALSSGSASVVVPAAAVFAPNALTVTFPVTTTGVSAEVVVPITAAPAQANLTLEKAALATVVAPAGCATTQFSATVNLNGMAPTGGTTVTLSALTSDVTPPASVTVEEGKTSATFVVQANLVTASVMTGVRATYDSDHRDGATRLDPGLNTISSSPSVIQWTCEPPVYVDLTVTLKGPAPQGGAVVNLTSHTDPAYLGAGIGPSQITVAAGQTSFSGEFSVGDPTTSYKLWFTGEYEGSTA
jgi:hypothetical protein